MDVRVFFFPTGEGGRSAFAQVGNPERGLGGIAADFCLSRGWWRWDFYRFGVRAVVFVDERRMGGVWFSSVCVVFGFETGFLFFCFRKKIFWNFFHQKKTKFFSPRYYP